MDHQRVWRGKVNILLIHQAFVATNEAGGTRHAEIGQILAQKGHHLSVITSSVSYLTGSEKESSKNSRPADPVEVIAITAGGGIHRSALSRVWAFILFMLGSFFRGVRLSDVDIVWGTSPNLFQALSAYAVAKVKRKPFVLEIRDLWPDFAIGMGVLKNRMLICASRRLEKFLYRHADSLVVNSPGFKSHIREVSGREAVLIPNGADLAMFEVSETAGSEARQALGIDPEDFVVMYTGAHGPANDLTTVLAAAEQLKAYDKIKFVLVGSGKEKKHLIELAASKTLSNVLFVPPIAKSEIACTMQAADAGLAILKNIPMFTTTYPNKVFDFMAAGKPVLCQIDGVIREVVEKHDCGVFVPLGNPRALAQAVLNLMNSPEACRRMGTNSRAAIRDFFSREKAAEQYENLFLSMTKSS